MSTVIGPTAAELKALVNHDISLAEMISAGHYGRVNDEIMAKHFPINRSGSAETSFELVHFNSSISSEDALKEMDKRGLRPANLAELLAFGAAFPEEQLRYPIVELSSVAEVFGVRCVACLSRIDSRRNLYLAGWGDRWSAHCRFLAARK